jgi:hypothetical protein
MSAFAAVRGTSNALDLSRPDYAYTTQNGQIDYFAALRGERRLTGA